MSRMGRNSKKLPVLAISIEISQGIPVDLTWPAMDQYNWDSIWLLREKAYKMHI
jgi:hypothetical protein